MTHILKGAAYKNYVLYPVKIAGTSCAYVVQK